jgi:hypothetical protein
MKTLLARLLRKWHGHKNILFIDSVRWRSSKTSFKKFMQLCKQSRILAKKIAS